MQDQASQVAGVGFDITVTETGHTSSILRAEQLYVVHELKYVSRRNDRCRRHHHQADYSYCHSWFMLTDNC